MQPLAPGVQLTDNLLLTEELPVPLGATYRVWYALNVQLSKIVVIKIYENGHLEAVGSDPVSGSATKPTTATRNAIVSASVGKPAQTITPSFGKEPANSTIDSVRKNESIKNQTQGEVSGNRVWLRNALIFILFSGLIIVGYLFRKPLIRQSRLISASLLQQDRPDSTTDQVPALIPAPEESPAENSRSDESTTMATMDVAPGDEPMSAPAPISPQQATRLLNLLPRIATGKHPAIFTDAQQSFTQLLASSSGRQSYVDSLYTVYTGRGAQSTLTHQQNGDSVSKQYAIDWYRTAYTLKPSPSLQARINRLSNTATATKRPDRTASKPVRPTGPLFMEDPEIN